MNTIAIIVFLGVISIIALETIIFWHRKTKGTWRRWPAGRSLMYLLMIIAFAFGFGVVNRILGDYPVREIASFVLYILFIAALIAIRITIAKELRIGSRAHPRHPISTMKREQ